MISHLHFHDSIILKSLSLVSFVPGIFYLILPKTTPLNRYSISLLLSFSLLSIIYFDSTVLGLILILLSLILVAKINKSTVNSKFFVVCILIPILEESLFKFFIVKTLQTYGIDIRWSIAFGLVSFLFAHSFTKNSYLQYALFYIGTFVLFVLTKSIYTPIIVHIIYNIYIYLKHYKNYIKQHTGW